MKTTQPQSTSPFDTPKPPQPSASPYPPASPTSHLESLPTVRSTSMSNPAANPPSLPMQEPPQLKTSQPSTHSNASASAPELIDPRSLAQPHHRAHPAPSPRPARLRRRSGLAK